MNAKSQTATGGLSSKLFRRATLLSAGLVIVVLLISLSVHLSGRLAYQRSAAAFLEELEAIVPDLSPAAFRQQIADLEPPTVADDHNAAKFFLAGSGAVVWPEGQALDLLRALNDSPTTTWTAEQRQAGVDLVELNRGALQTLRSGGALDQSDYGVDYSQFVDAEVPNLIQILNAARLLELESRLAFTDGRVEEAVTGLQTLGRMGETLREESILIFSLIAHVVERLQLQGIAQVVAADGAGAQEPKLLEQLVDMVPDDDLLAQAYELVVLDAAVVAIALIEGGRDLDGLVESRLTTYLHGHRQGGYALDQGREAVKLARTPFGSDPEAFTAEDQDPDLGLGSAYRNSLAKAQLAVAERLLVSTGLELQLARLAQGMEAHKDFSPKIDPFSGQQLIYEPSADGSARLAIADGEALVVAVQPPKGTGHIFLSLELPPPNAITGTP